MCRSNVVIHDDGESLPQPRLQTRPALRSPPKTQSSVTCDLATCLDRDAFLAPRKNVLSRRTPKSKHPCEGREQVCRYNN
eukprot:2317994-Amphidinium_carterae.1